MPAAKKGQKKPRKEKKVFLPNNKALFKGLIPKDPGFAAHLNRIRIGDIDIPFFILVFVLLVFGVIMMYSASYAWAIKDNVAPDYYFKHQLQMAGIGLVIMALVSSKLFDYHILKNPYVNLSFFFICTALMLMVHLSVFKLSTADANRWIDLGFFSFQPSELMKLAVIILFSSMISANHQKMTTFKYGILPYLFVLGFVCILTLLQRHLSGTIIICAIGVAMLLVGGCNPKHFALLVLAALIAVPLGIFILYQTDKFDYINERLISWWYTFEPENKQIAWQTRNSLIAIGSGNIFGLGLGNSRQKFLYLPESKNDFVFAIVCEELGFLGASVVILLFLMLVFRGFSIARNAPDKFGMLLAAGLSIQVGLQAMLNIAVVTNTIPNTGISLPFFSYGGSALIVQLAQMGLILNISRQSIPSREEPDSDDAASELEKQQIKEAKRQLGAAAKVRRINKEHREH
ncbi:MAG: putative lipid II flippase FtsW [Oscillospiraceae bacterium]|nr:putative lipid II flippase FtsW [Oscillospiraceae bacterium]